MALSPLQLDDLTWADLSRAARDRIVGASQGQWTLHAPVDPGITLLELFAAQLEQRLYSMDQPSPARTAALLRLLDIRPRQAASAATVLYCRADEVAYIDRHDRFQLSAPQPLTFSATSELLVLPLVESAGMAAELFVNGRSRTLEIQTGRQPCLISTHGAQRDAYIEFTTRGPLPEETDYRFSLFFDLVTPPQIRQQWETPSRPAAPVAPPAVVQWHYLYQDRWVPLGPENVVDGTNGFRKSGVVQLPMFPVAGAQPADKSTRHRLRVRVTRADYSFTPQVVRILPNAVPACHAASVSTFSVPEPAGLERQSPPIRCDEYESRELLEQLSRWRPLAGNELQLPVEYAPPLVNQRFELQLRERSRPVDDCNPDTDAARWHTWQLTDDFSFSGPSDRHVVLDRPSRRIIFGNGLNGRIPILEPLSADPAADDPAAADLAADDLRKVLRLRYDFGGGAAGNVRRGESWRPEKESPVSAVNLVAGAGGFEHETIEDLAERGRDEVRRVERTITASDVELIARSTPDVALARAHAVGGLHPDYRIPVTGAITVVVVPDIPRNVDPLADSCGDDLTALRIDEAARRAVADHLERHRLLTQEIHVQPAKYRDVDLWIDIMGRPYDPPAVEAGILRRLREYMHPTVGGDETPLPLAMTLHPSQFAGVVARSLDDALTVGRVGIHLAGPHQPRPLDHEPGYCECPADSATTVDESEFLFCEGDNLRLCPAELPILREVVIRFQPSANEQGVLS